MSGSGPVGVAVIGAGNISKQYPDNLTVFPDLAVHVIVDLRRKFRPGIGSPPRDWDPAASTL